MPFKRYNTSNGQDFRTNYVGRDGELTWDSDNGLRLHDGSTSGGNPVGSGSLTAVNNNIEVIVSDTNQGGVSISQTINNGNGSNYFSTELQYDQFSIDATTGYQWRFEDTGEFRIPGNINSYDNDINIIAMHAGSNGNITIKTVSNTNDVHYSQLQLTQTGIALTVDLNNTQGGRTFEFSNTGALILPSLDTYDNTGATVTGPTLKLGNDPDIDQTVITGPAPNGSYPNAPKIIIQGQRGYGNSEQSGGYQGGDVLVWAGRGGEGSNYSGVAGNVDIRGATGGLNGGNIRVRSGNANGGNGSVGGFLELAAGNTTYDLGAGGNVDIRAGYGVQSGTGGEVNIYTASTGSTYDNTWTFGKNGTTTLPGAVIQGTVAKTVGTTPLYLGDSGFTTPLVDGDYGPFTLSGIVFTVQVLSGTPGYTITSIPENPNFTRTQVIGTLDSDDLGGAPGETRNIDVSELVPTVLDLTKSINKLADGGYSLANGTEGQIMHLVRQTGSSEGSIRLTVGNARVDGSTYTNYSFVPFTAGTSLDIAMMIFTDGRWQSDNGLWGS
jgi:hypothetical protein